MLNRIKMVLVAGTAALLFAPASWAVLASYSQNFEALGAGDPSALSADGFLVSGVVFSGAAAPAPYGGFKFFYGNFPAPNNTAPNIPDAFSGIETGESGVPQGLNVLNVYSDYQCCLNTSEGHFDATGPHDIVQSNVFREQTIGLADIGTTWSFKFDAKARVEIGCASTPDSDCVAFIRTLDPGNGFALTNFVTFDSQANLTANWSTQSISIDLSDPLLNGQILQFGFQSTSKQFGNTGVFYDNIVFALAPDPNTDTDGDGIQDPIDNCRLTANPLQQDANLDGFGNICDADINNSGTVTTADFGVLRSVLGQSASFSPTAAAADMNGSGTVTTADFGLLRARLGTAPGPSGLACAGTIPCP